MKEKINNIFKLKYYTPIITYLVVTLAVQLVFSFIVTNNGSGKVDEQWLNTYNSYLEKYAIVLQMIIALFAAFLMFLGKKRKLILSSLKNPLNAKFVFIIPFSIGAAFTLNYYANLFSKNVTGTVTYGSLSLQLLSIGIIIPMAEEIIFRGIIYNRMKKHNTITVSAFYSSILFALMHLSNPTQLFYSFALGIVIIFVMETYDDLKAAMFVHVFSNVTVDLYNHYIAQDISFPVFAVSFVSFMVVGALMSASYKHKGLQKIYDNK